MSQVAGQAETSSQRHTFREYRHSPGRFCIEVGHRIMPGTCGRLEFSDERPRLTEQRFQRHQEAGENVFAIQRRRFVENGGAAVRSIDRDRASLWLHDPNQAWFRRTAILGLFLNFRCSISWRHNFDCDIRRAGEISFWRLISWIGDAGQQSQRREPRPCRDLSQAGNRFRLRKRHPKNVSST